MNHSFHKRRHATVYHDRDDCRWGQQISTDARIGGEAGLRRCWNCDRLDWETTRGFLRSRIEQMQEMRANIDDDADGDVWRPALVEIYRCIDEMDAVLPQGGRR